MYLNKQYLKIYSYRKLQGLFQQFKVTFAAMKIPHEGRKKKRKQDTLKE